MKYGKNSKNVRTRLSRGWSIEQALGLLPKPERIAHNRVPVQFKFNGKKYEYESITSAAQAMGLNEFLVFNRVNARKWSIEQALELEPPPEHSKACYGYIYLVTNIENKKQYVGQTMRTIEERWEDHCNPIFFDKKTNPNSLAYAIHINGRNQFIFTDLDIANTHAELNKKEIYWIKKLKTLSPNGYNLSRGGSGISKGQAVMVGDNKYCSISDVAREYDFKESVIHDRVRRGWTIEQSLELVPLPNSHKYAGRKINIYENKQKLSFNSVASLARNYDLSVSVVSQRLNKSNWTPEQAVGLVPAPKWVHPKHSLTLCINGINKSFISKEAVAKEYGFKYWSIIGRRLKRGWSLEQALDIYPKPDNKFKVKTVTITAHGNTTIYTSQAEAARAYGICQKKVSARKKLGWSYEEALEIVPRKKELNSSSKCNTQS